MSARTVRVLWCSYERGFSVYHQLCHGWTDSRRMCVCVNGRGDKVDELHLLRVVIVLLVLRFRL